MKDIHTMIFLAWFIFGSVPCYDHISKKYDVVFQLNVV